VAVVAAGLGLLAFSWFWIVPNTVVDGSPLAGAREATGDLDVVFAALVVVVAGMLAAVGVTAVGGRAWALTALLVLFGAGAVVGAMPDALYAVIILAGLGTAVAALRHRSRKPDAPARA
jgi:hypothetical protein